MIIIVVVVVVDISSEFDIYSKLHSFVIGEKKRENVILYVYLIQPINQLV